MSNAICFARRKLFPSLGIEDLIQGLNQLVTNGIVLAIAFAPDYGNRSALEGLGAMASIFTIAFANDTSGDSVMFVIFACVFAIIWIALQSKTIGILGAVAGVDDTIPPGDAKASVLVPITCVIFFLIHMIRMRGDKVNSIGRGIQTLYIVGNFAGYWAPVSTNPLDSIWRIVVTMFILAGLRIVVSFFIVPVPSGPRCVTAFVSFLDLLAQVTRHGCQYLQALKSSCPTLSPGEVENVKMRSREAYCELLKLDLDVKLSYGKFLALLKSSKVDMNIYGKPHLFKHEAFSSVGNAASTCHQVTMVALRYICKGEIHLHQDEELLSSILKVCEAQYLSLKHLSSLDRDIAIFPDAVEAMAGVQNDVMVLLKLRHRRLDTPTHRVIDMLFFSALSLQTAFMKIPQCFPAIEANLLLGLKDWPKESSEILGVHTDIRQLVLERVKFVVKQIQNHESEFKTQNYREFSGIANASAFLKRISGTGIVGRVQVGLFKAADRFGIRWWHWTASVQATSALAISLALVVNTSVNEAFEGHIWWAAMTVPLVTDSCVRGSTNRAIQRAIGTLFGCLGAAVSVLLGYLASGLRSKLSDAGLAVELVLTAILMFLCRMMNHAAEQNQKYTWFVAGLTIPVLVLTSQTEVSIVWSSLGFRIAATMLAIALVTVFEGFLLPMTTIKVVKKQIADTLAVTSDLIEVIAKQSTDILCNHNGKLTELDVNFIGVINILLEIAGSIKDGDPIGTFLCCFESSDNSDLEPLKHSGKNPLLPVNCCCLPPFTVNRKSSVKISLAIADIVQEFRREEMIQRATIFLRKELARAGIWNLNPECQKLLCQIANVHAECLRSLRLYILGIISRDMIEEALLDFKMKSLKAINTTMHISWQQEDNLAIEPIIAVVFVLCFGRTEHLYNTIQNSLASYLQQISTIEMVRRHMCCKQSNQSNIITAETRSSLTIDDESMVI